VREFRAAHQGGIWGLYWDFHLNELAIAHYERACVALYGVRPGEDRPAGKPAPEALDRAEAALAPALALYGTLSSAQQRAGAALFHCQSLIAEYRGDHEAALVHALKALATNDDLPHYHSTVAGCLNNLGRLDEALVHAARALDVDGKHWHAHYVTACVLAKRGGDRAAIFDHLRRVVALWPAAPAELAVEPDLAPLRDDPAFRKLIKPPAAKR
jgi:tetratricopeptide (TPR) repeat protein